MQTTEAVSADKIEISLIRRDAPDRVSTIYLLLQHGRPIELGAGRFALVWLASEGIDVPNSRLLALKLVRSSPESAVISSVARWRFFEEILKTSQHATAAREGLVEYFGFGTFSSIPFDWRALELQKNDVDGRSEWKFFSDPACHSLIDKVRERNSTVLPYYFKRGPDAKLQGEFYAMPAAHGTLEELLLHPHDWGTNNIYARPDTSARISLNSFRNKAQTEAFSRQFYSNRDFGTSQSGLSLLKNLNDPRLRNRIVLLLSHRVSKALAALHTCRSDGEGFLAHRDVKLGNFLLVGSTLPDVKFAVADLGFVGGQESVAAAGLTGALNAREAFVLPPGTFPFRAPEQIQPVNEVTCSAAPGVEPTVAVRAFTDIDLEVGDWLESPDLVFGDCKQREKRAKILDITRKPDGLRAGRTAMCKISCKVDFQGQKEVRGSVIKLAAQHSDLFSLGALVYFIITGGGNPEMFWARCVALAQELVEATPQARADRASSVFDTCESLAIALCNDGGEMFLKDLKHLRKQARESAALAGKNKQERQIGRWLQDTYEQVRLGSILGDERRRQASVLTESPTIRPLLRDMVGDRITLPIMLIIVRCMLRGKEDSFVKQTATIPTPMSAWPLEGQSDVCAADCLSYVQYPSADINLGKWLSLGMEACDIFLALRFAGSGKGETPAGAGT